MEYNKTLIYYFFIDKDYKENRSVLIHLKCLEHYHNVFNNAIFYISIKKEWEDYQDSVIDLEKKIVSIGYKNVQFKIVENTIFNESSVFFEEVINNEDLHGLIFFGHNKGYTNYITFPDGSSVDTLDDWLLGLYFLSLNYIDDVEDRMLKIFPLSTFYGSFLLEDKQYTKNGIHYSGSFFWLNIDKLHEYYNSIPKLLDRYSCEQFAGNLCKWNEWYGLTSYNNFLLYPCSLYRDANNCLQAILEDKYVEFDDFKKNIIENL